MEEFKTRVFFVVDSVEDNEEIFETLESAQTYFLTLEKENKPRIYIAIVRNAYEEEDLDEHVGTTWNYEDLSNTFEIIKVIDEYK